MRENRPFGSEGVVTQCDFLTPVFEAWLLRNILRPVALFPQQHATFQRCWQLLVQTALRFGIVSAGAEVSQDDQLILKPFRTFQNVIQMHVPELVNLFFAMFWAKERHFRDQYFGRKVIRMCIKANW